MDALVTKPALADVSFLDWTPGGGRPAEPELAGKCRTALEERVQRQSALPELYIDPLRVLVPHLVARSCMHASACSCHI